MSDYVCYIHSLSSKWKKINVDKDQMTKVISFSKLSERINQIINKEKLSNS